MKRTIVALLAAAALLVSPAAAEAKTYSHASATSKAHHCKANKGWNSAPGYGNKAQCVYVSAPKGYKLIQAGETIRENDLNSYVSGLPWLLNNKLMVPCYAGPPHYQPAPCKR